VNPLDLEITRHAAARWMERTGYRDPVIARAKWDETIGRAEVAAIKESQRLRALLRHGCREATYLRSGEWVFVVAEGHVVTVHNNTADLLEKGPGSGYTRPACPIDYIGEWTPPPGSNLPNLNPWVLLIDGMFRRSYKDLGAAEQAAGDILKLTGGTAAIGRVKS
jgi:hypothetical protein